MVLLARKQASRKFIDLINTASSKWANWDPAIPVQPGDYGAVDKESGHFQKEGNIFHEAEILDIVSKYRLISGPRVYDYIIHSLDVKNVQDDPDMDVLGGAAEPTFGGQWKFGRNRGALLLLYGSRITKLPDELLEELKETDWAHGKHIVSHIHSCPAYALYLSDRSNETVTLSLRAGSPLGPTGIVPGVDVSATWIASGVSGIFQRACANGPVFVPLYQIKGIRKRKGRRRESPDPTNDEKEDWVAIEVPWNYLDQDGVELADLTDEDFSDLD